MAAYYRAGALHMTRTQQDGKSADRMEAENRAIECAMWEAAKEAILLHKRLGLPMVEWHDGQIVWIPADKLDLDDEPAAS
jgi:hypothetical protein